MFDENASDPTLSARLAALEAELGQLQALVAANAAQAGDAVDVVAGDRQSGDDAALGAVQTEAQARVSAVQAVDNRIGDEILRASNIDQQHGERIEYLEGAGIAAGEAVTTLQRGFYERFGNDFTLQPEGAVPGLETMDPAQNILIARANRLAAAQAVAKYLAKLRDGDRSATLRFERDFIIDSAPYIGANYLDNYGWTRHSVVLDAGVWDENAYIDGGRIIFEGLLKRIENDPGSRGDAADANNSTLLMIGKFRQPIIQGLFNHEGFQVDTLMNGIRDVTSGDAFQASFGVEGLEIEDFEGNKGANAGIVFNLNKRGAGSTANAPLAGFDMRPSQQCRFNRVKRLTTFNGEHGCAAYGGTDNAIDELIIGQKPYTYGGVERTSFQQRGIYALGCGLRIGTLRLKGVNHVAVFGTVYDETRSGDLNLRIDYCDTEFPISQDDDPDRYAAIELNNQNNGIGKINKLNLSIGHFRSRGHKSAVILREGNRYVSVTDRAFGTIDIDHWDAGSILHGFYGKPHAGWDRIRVGSGQIVVRSNPEISTTVVPQDGLLLQAGARFNLLNAETVTMAQMAEPPFAYWDGNAQSERPYGYIKPNNIKKVSDWPGADGVVPVIYDPTPEEFGGAGHWGFNPTTGAPWKLLLDEPVRAGEVDIGTSLVSSEAAPIRIGCVDLVHVRGTYGEYVEAGLDIDPEEKVPVELFDIGRFGTLDYSISDDAAVSDPGLAKLASKGDLLDFAPLASPAFLDMPTAPTATGDNPFQIANAQYVQSIAQSLTSGFQFYQTVEEGLAATDDEEYFSAPSAPGLTIYRNDDGEEVEISTQPSVDYVTGAIAGKQDSNGYLTQISGLLAQNLTSKLIFINALGAMATGDLFQTGRNFLAAADQGAARAVLSVDYADQPMAEAGTSTGHVMSPQRATQHFNARVGSYIRGNGFLSATNQVEARTSLSLAYADQAAAEGGTLTGVVMSPQRATQHFNARTSNWLRASGALMAASQPDFCNKIGAASEATGTKAYRQGINYLTGVAGTGALFTAASDGTMPAPATRSVFAFVPHLDSEAAPSLIVDGGEPLPIRGQDGTVLPAGALRAGNIYILINLGGILRLILGSIALIAAELAAVKDQLSNLTGGDVVSDVYDESTAIGTSPVVIVQGDQPVASLSIQNQDETADVKITLGDGAEITLPPLAQLDQKGLPPGPIKAQASEANTAISILVGNNSRTSPNAPRRATALLKALDAAGGSVISSDYEAAIRSLYYEMDRLGLIRPAGGLFVCANKTAGAGLVDWVSLESATAFGAPTFTPGEGYSFNGVDQYIDTLRRMQDAPSAGPHNAAMAMFARATSGTQLARFAAGDGSWAIGPYRSGTTWAGQIGAVNPDIVTGATSEGDLLIQRVDDDFGFAHYKDHPPQRFARDGRETLLTTTVMIGTDSSGTIGVPNPGNYWAGQVKALWFGAPMGRHQWLAMRSAMNTYLDTVEDL